ncbi:MAG: transposase [Scytonematopsis contorta HA4267-MV1]|nr:transposase [Scytonematopsis contorta HA4267-MV1]
MRKLTEPDKKEILKLYRESAETTSTLAERYDVSNSTISRLLKSTLPEDEYEYLVSLKRAARTPEGRAQVSYDNIPVFSGIEEEEEEEQPKVVIPTPTPVKSKVVVDKKAPPEKPVKPQPRKIERVERVEEEEETSGKRRVRRRNLSEAPGEQIAEQLELLDLQPSSITPIPSPLVDDAQSEATIMAAAQMFGEEVDDSDDLDDLDDLDYDDEDDDDDDIEPFKSPIIKKGRSGEALVRVLPFSSAPLPKTCYLVIDRAAELITRPLRDFGDLGQIPNLETQQRTLPVFDNHRVAKRFSTKRDRVIKVPDSRMLQKARVHLEAKGITRLLIDGQVYSLSNA